MDLGIFVNKNHINFIPFISFLTSQIADKDNINIHIVDYKTKIKDLQFYDMNLYITRYCLIRLDKILKQNYLNKIFLLPCYHKKALVLFSKHHIKKEYGENTILDIAELLEPLDHNLFDKECYLHNIGCVNCKAEDSVFVCYNDLDKNFIDFCKEHFYESKRIYYNGVIYSINPNKYFFKHNNTDVCILNKNLTVSWDPKNNKWKKLNKGIKKLC